MERVEAKARWKTPLRLTILELYRLYDFDQVAKANDKLAIEQFQAAMRRVSPRFVPRLEVAQQAVARLVSLLDHCAAALTVDDLQLLAVWPDLRVTYPGTIEILCPRTDLFIDAPRNFEGWYSLDSLRLQAQKLLQARAKS